MASDEMSPGSEVLVSLSAVPAVTTTGELALEAPPPIAAPLGGTPPPPAAAAESEEQVPPPPQQGMELSPAALPTLGAPQELPPPVPSTMPQQSPVPVPSSPMATTPTVDLSASEKKRRRRGWTDEEEKRLREGVAQHGAGQWAKIRDSYGFKSENEGEGRSCVNLKDKWRNLNRPARPEKPPKAREEKQNRPPRKKKTRTPKRKRSAGGADGAAGGAADGSQDENEGGANRAATDSTTPPPWMPNAAAWCRANLTKTEKGKVHVGTLRQKFSQSLEFFPKADVWDGDESEVENLKYDLENPKTEASKKFRSEALEPFVGADAIRQNCFIGGLNQLGVFGWSVKGEEPSPRARAGSRGAQQQQQQQQQAPDLVEVTAEQQAAAEEAQSIVNRLAGVDANVQSLAVVQDVVEGGVVDVGASLGQQPTDVVDPNVVPAALGATPAITIAPPEASVAPPPPVAPAAPPRDEEHDDDDDDDGPPQEDEPAAKRVKTEEEEEPPPALQPPNILLHLPDPKDMQHLVSGTVGQVTVPPPAQPTDA